MLISRDARLGQNTLLNLASVTDDVTEINQSLLPMPYDHGHELQCIDTLKSGPDSTRCMNFCMTKSNKPE